jgi:hypothetical protein
MNWKRSITLLVVCLGCTWGAHAQRAPRIGFIYPAGGQAGQTFEAVVGGQGLDEPQGAVVSGEGVSVQIIEHLKPLGAVAAGDLREKVREMQTKLKEQRQDGKIAPADMLPTIRRIMREASVTERDLLQLADYDRRRNDPKQQQNVQIGETVRVKITIDEKAAYGTRYWRLHTAYGVSNPMRFIVGQHPEIREAEPPPEFDFEHYAGGVSTYRRHERTKKALVTPTTSLPVTINGRVLPGEVDNFSIQAKKGEQIVVSVQARHLIPYLADAVPGWFQAIVSLTSPQGEEVAYADDYHFDPDPVLFYKIPYDGEFHVRVHDSIYRGREDFVYRITIGALPFITGITPLGARAGSLTDLTFLGGNLRDQAKQKFTAPESPGTIALHAQVGPWTSNFIPFQIDTLDEEKEREPNDRMGVGAQIKTPVVINGCIQSPRDADYFQIKGRGNRPMVFEIFARRLGSPLDSNLAIFDTAGKEIASNDDNEDLAAGLTTHHADSRVVVKMPPSGECFARVTDTQNQSSEFHEYRLRVAPAKPSFLLRATPSTLNAKPGGTARLSIHALRVDGFTGEIALSLKDSPAGFELKNAVVPAGKDVAEVSVSVPSGAAEEPVRIHVQGTAQVDEESHEKLTVDAVPAEDMMQAFIYRHLVPVDDLFVDVRTPPAKAAK